MGKNTLSAASTADFIPRLHAERDALKAFVTLLETEQQALLGGYTEQLLTLADSKTQAVHELSKLANVRRNELLARGAKTEAGGSIAAWLQTHAADSLPVWHSIQQLAEQAQHLNRTNGVLIQTKLRHNQQALAALQNAAHSVNGLYGPDGQPHLPTSGRTLGSV